MMATETIDWFPNSLPP